MDAPTAASGVGRRLGAVGAYSYSLYLVRCPVCVAVGHLALRAGVTDPRAVLVGVVSVSVALSALLAKWFYARVESRCLNNGKSPGAITPGLSRLPHLPVSSSRTRPSAC